MNRALALALLPLVLLVAAAAVESLRLPLLVALAIGLLVVWRTSRGEALVWSACLLVAINLASVGLSVGTLFGSAADCAGRFWPFAGQRAVGAAVVLVSAAVVLRVLGVGPADIGLRWSSRASGVVALAALPVLGVAAAFIGPTLAKPFFGPVASPTADVASLAPALLFAVANASMEEVVYRGALMKWLTPVAGTASALALQALVFGLAHGVGADFVGSPLPVMAATAAAGLLFGVLALRTNSLVLPIAVHMAFDIPVFFGKVCLGS
jgi:membrane protease YdiL (CAAX protease family)